MRALILAVMMGLAAPATAGVLPITGSYCYNATDGTAGTRADSDGLRSEEDLFFAKIIKSGPNWWDVAYKPSDYVDPGTVDHVTLSKDKKTLTVGTIVLHRCH